jgi:steroid delta-isomerase-like uncharacterized protein
MRRTPHSVRLGKQALDQEVRQVAGAREINDRYTAAVRAHDLETILGLFAPDGRIQDPTATYEGRDGVREYWGRFFEAFPDLDATDDITAVAGDTVLNEWTAGGTNTGPLDLGDETIPATGKKVRLRGADVVEVRGGKIQSHRAYYDLTAFMSQLGLVPEGAVA